MRPYIIASGFYAAYDMPDEGGEPRGAAIRRSASFGDLWYKSIIAYTNPERIIVTDSNSPVRPVHASFSTVNWVRLNRNFGHPTDMHRGAKIHSGWSRSALMGLMYARCCECDFVYVEQDCLLYGDDIVDVARRSTDAPFIFGNGHGTPQPIEQSFCIVRYEVLNDFIQWLTDDAYVPESDAVVSSERKWFIGAQYICDRIGGPLPADLPFGYGRTRPMDMSDEHFYFQKGSVEQIVEYIERTGFEYTAL